MKLVLLILLLLLPLYYFTKPGFFPMHDDTQVARVEQMAKSLSQGQFPVRWVGDLGYGFGYPIFNFYNPLPYYFGGFFDLLGFSSLFSTKMMFIVGFLLAGLGMYLLVKKYLDVPAGLLAGVIYGLAPYHAVQVYVRGSVAELWAYGLLPFLVLFLLERRVIKTALILALIILSHNITALIIIILLSFWCLIDLKKNFIFFIKVIFIALGLSAFFWLPAFWEKNYTGVEAMVWQQFNPLEHFVYPWQFWNSSWGWGGSAPGILDGMSFQIGKLQLVLSIAALALMPFFAKNKKIKPLYFLAVSLLVLSIFLMLPLSSFLWTWTIKFSSYIQFPWRFLTFASLASSILSAIVFFALEKKIKKKELKLALCLAFLFLVFFLNLKYFQPQYTYPADDNYFLKKEKISWETSKISDEYLPKDFPRPDNITPVFDGNFNLQNTGQLQVEKQTFTNYIFVINTLQDNLLLLHTAYFPGWKAYLDKKPIEINSQSYFIQVNIPAGQHTLEIKFTNTPIRTIADIFTIITILGIIFWKLRKVTDD